MHEAHPQLLPQNQKCTAVKNIFVYCSINILFFAGNKRLKCSNTTMHMCTICAQDNLEWSDLNLFRSTNTILERFSVRHLTAHTKQSYSHFFPIKKSKKYQSQCLVVSHG